LRIDEKRFRADFEALNQFGKTSEGGVNRPALSLAHLAARRWFREQIEQAGLQFQMDAAGNHSAFLACGPEGAPSLLIGSHLDSVPNGGRFDGALGVLAGLQVLRSIQQAGLRLPVNLELFDFTDEEGSLAGDFLGSRAFTGTLDRDLLEGALAAPESTLAKALGGAGLSLKSILGAAAEALPVEAFLELHVEQGPILDDEGVPVGLVDVISGKRYLWCSFQGEAGHAGTVPLEIRRDAFLGLADFALRATRHVATRHYGSFVTIGKARIHPGAFSIIPGRADFSLDFRSRSPKTLAALETELRDLAGEIAATRGLRFASRLMDATDPVIVPERLRIVLERACSARGYAHLDLASGAGHDAQILAAAAPTAMIFIPSPDGISHAPEESVRWDDLEKGANILLDALALLASK